MNKKNLLITANTRAMLETFRYWILSLLNDEISIKTVCFKESRSFFSDTRCFDVTVALVFEEREIELAQISLKEIEISGLTLGTTIMVHSSSLQKYSMLMNLHSFAQRVPLATCMHHILRTLQVTDSLYVQEAKESFSPFTKREKQVLEFLAQGIGIKEIAHVLGISKYTVITYQRSLYLKTGARTLQQLALFAALHVRATS